MVEDLLHHHHRLHTYVLSISTGRAMGNASYSLHVVIYFSINSSFICFILIYRPILFDTRVLQLYNTILFDTQVQYPVLQLYNTIIQIRCAH